MRTFQFEYYMKRDKRTFPLVVELQRRTKGRGVEEHAHDFLEITYVAKGTAVTTIDGASYKIARGDLFVVNMGSSHSYSDCDEFKYFDVLIPPDFFSPGELESFKLLAGFHELFWLESMFRKEDGFRTRLHLSAKVGAEVEDLLYALDAELESRPNGYEIISRAHLVALLTKICRSYSRQIEQTNRQAATRGRRKAIMDVIAYVEDHCSEEIDLKKMASLAYLSSRHFSTLFHQTVGMTPIEFLNHSRIGRAKELLADSGLAITQVAFEVGFHDSSYFTKMFKRLTGQTPRAYRGSHGR